MEELTFVPVNETSELLKKEIASIVFELDKQFYTELFPGKGAAVDSIARSLDEVGGDLGCGLVAYSGERPVGYLSFFPVEQKTIRNLATLKSMFDMSESKTLAKVKEAFVFKGKLAPLPPKGLYLNKILILPKNKGIGSRLFSYYLSQSEKLDLSAIFHVKQDNLNALKFYNRQGFQAEHSSHEYLLCMKQ